MKRLHLFELEDQRWFPGPIRDAGTDFIRFMAEASDTYRPVIPKLNRALAESGSQEVLDLCSGGGGPVVRVRNQLAKAGCDVKFALADMYPNRSAFEHSRKRSGGSVDFIEKSVDATAVPGHLSGFRTLFASFHHFRPEAARRILRDAVEQRRPIGVFEITTHRNPLFILPMTLLNTLMVLLVTPFIRPFRWSRLLWTYPIPIVPLYVM